MNYQMSPQKNAEYRVQSKAVYHRTVLDKFIRKTTSIDVQGAT